MFNFVAQIDSLRQLSSSDGALNSAQPRKTIVYSTDFYVFILPV